MDLNKNDISQAKIHHSSLHPPTCSIHKIHCVARCL